MDQNLASKMGLAGGIIGLIAAPFIQVIGAFIVAFGGQANPLFAGIIGGILAFIGLIGALFVKKNPKPAGAIMLICGLLGLPFGLGFWIGALLLIAAGIIVFVGKKVA
jgi:hypothetical protein